jgi:hypothetical protein
MGELQVLVQSEGDVGFQVQLQELAMRQMHARRTSADPLIRDLKLELLGILLALFGDCPGYVRQPECREQDEEEVR